MVDYSKWNHIEISDDEDDTHPNIDTASLHRWRHQARVERMAEQEKEKEKFQAGYKTHQQKMTEMKQKLKEAERTSEMTSELENLKLKMSELEKQEKEWKKKEEDLIKKERMTPWNIDTICHDGKSKTIINKSAPKKELTEDEKIEKQANFTKTNETKLKKYGMFHRYEDSEAFLIENPFLACEETANYLVIWCINLEVEQKSDLMNHVAHQTITMQFILELAKQMDLDPKSCIRPFFQRIKKAEKQYMDAFNDELESFKGRVKVKAQAKIDKYMKEIEEEERQERLGPGGLDPVEVFESLPESLKECFDKKDIPMLQKVISEMPKEDAEYHMKRCVDSGLWVPNAKDLEKEQSENTSETPGEEKQEASGVTSTDELD